MNAEFDLENLPDSVFEVHEEILGDENTLFSLPSLLDDIMAKNPQAKVDGVFKARLAPGLMGKGSSLKDIWALFGVNNKEYLQAQFLKSEDRPQCYVMENGSLKVRHQTTFAAACRNEETFHKPSRCTQVLENSGPQAAVKHFYEALKAKAVVVGRDDPLKKNQQQSSYTKHKFEDRQKVLQQDLDPETKCAIIEQSMRSKSYAVTETGPAAADNGKRPQCRCRRCQESTQSAELHLNMEMCKEDGDGDHCSLYFNGIEESQQNFAYITPNFALSHLCHLNMLTDIDCFYSGILFPFIYIGGLHSFFPIHVEDMSLWSINYLHLGCPKLIAVVAPCDVLKLSLVLTHYGLSNVHRNCMFKLSHKGVVVFPQLLVFHKIRFKIIFQKPGDFIFFAPNAAHTGGNMGPNIAEACNIGTPGWLPYGSVAAHNSCNCMEDAVHMDVTPLFEIHRKDLLKYHLNKCMHTEYKDKFFQNSILVVTGETWQDPEVVVAPPASATLAPTPSTSSAASGTPQEAAACITSRGKNTKVMKAAVMVSCPVQRCFKEYKDPTRRTMENHIKREHPEKAPKKKIKAALDAMFPTCSGLRRPCPG